MYEAPALAPGSDVVVTFGGGNTVIESEADFVLSATEVAVTVTERLVVTALGAV